MPLQPMLVFSVRCNTGLRLRTGAEVLIPGRRVLGVLASNVIRHRLFKRQSADTRLRRQACYEAVASNPVTPSYQPNVAKCPDV